MPEDNEEKNIVIPIKAMLNEKDPAKIAGFFYGFSLGGMLMLGIFLTIAAYNIMNGFKTDFQAIMTGLFLIIFAIVLLKAISLFCKYHNKIPISSNRLTPEEVMVKIHKVDTSDGGEPLLQVHKTDLEESLELPYYAYIDKRIKENSDLEISANPAREEQKAEVCEQSKLVTDPLGSKPEDQESNTQQKSKDQMVL